MRMRDDFEFSLETLDPECEFRIDSGKKLMLGFGVTTACNYDCPMCFYHAANNRHSKIVHIDLDIVNSTLSSIGILSLVNISLQGEPLLHPAIYDILEISENHADNIVMCTNGSLLDQRTLGMLARIKPLKLAVSLDACDQRTYALMRGKDNFNQIIQNIRKAIESLGERVELNFILCGQNRDSLHELPEMANNLGIQKANMSMLRETAMTRANGIIPLKIADATNFAAHLQKRCAERGVALEFDGAVSSKHCIFPFIYTSILADGTLFPCCGDFRPCMVKSYDFEGIFNHPYLKRIRGALVNKRILSACAKCMRPGA